MTKVGVVITREFLSTVKRRSYLVVTLGMPFFLGAYMVMVGVLPMYFMTRAGARQKPVGIVDLAGLVRLDEERGPRQDETAAGSAALDLVDRVASAQPQTKGVIAFLREIDTPVPFVALPSKEEALRRLRDGAPLKPTAGPGASYYPMPRVGDVWRFMRGRPITRLPRAA